MIYHCTPLRAWMLTTQCESNRARKVNDKALPRPRPCIGCDGVEKRLQAGLEPPPRDPPQTNSRRGMVKSPHSGLFLASMHSLAVTSKSISLKKLRNPNPAKVKCEPRLFACDRCGTQKWTTLITQRFCSRQCKQSHKSAMVRLERMASRRGTDHFKIKRGGR